MATKEAQSQLAMLPERVAVVETKVHQIEEKLDELKLDVKEMHDCLDQTRDLISNKLKEMSAVSDAQHGDLAKEIKELKNIKDKWTTYALATLAFLGGAGWFNSVSFPTLLKFFGL